MYNGQRGLVDVPGVTSILRNIDKSGLGFARANESAKCAWSDLGKLVDWAIQREEKAFINHVKGAAQRKWGQAADLGTEVHALAEARFHGEDLGRVHPDHAGFMTQLDKWIKDFDVEPIEIEATCWHETLGYAGTADLIARVAGEVILVDLKTGASGIFPDVALQLSAYVHAEFLVDASGERRELPELSGAAALSLRPDHYSLVPVNVDDSVFSIFEHLVAVSQWQRDISRSVLGAPVQPETSGV